MPDKDELLLELLREVNQGMGKCMREVLAKHEIPFTMMVVARHISRAPGITVSELSRRANMAKSHISNHIRRLSQRGWVETKADAADQRLLRLYLTDQAMEQLVLLKKEIKAELGLLVAGMPEETATGLIGGLEYIKSALDRTRKDKPGCW